MSQDTERTNNSQANNVDDKNVIDDTAIYYYKADNTQKNIYTYVEPDEEEEKENTDSTDKDDGDTDATENLEDEDFSEDMSDEDKETIKKVANDDNVSQAKSYASILVEQVMDAKETFERSLGSLFTSAFTAGLEIGISFFGSFPNSV